MDKLFISGLQFEAMIGVYAEERRVKQTIRVDVEMTVDTKAAIASDRILQAVDYAVLVEHMTQWISTTDFHLVESLADFLALKILSTFPIESVWLKLYKFTEKVPADSVGIIVERSSTP